MNFLLPLLLVVVFLFLFEYIARTTEVSKIFMRALAHMLLGLALASLPLFLAFEDIAFFSAAFLLVLLISRRKKFFKALHEAEHKTYGEIYLPATALFMALAFPDARLFSFGMLVIAVADGLAGLLGTHLGTKKYSAFGTNKSYAGSTAFFLSCLLLANFFAAAYSPDSPIFAIALITSLVLTFFEAALRSGLDNLILPPAAAALIVILSKLL